MFRWLVVFILLGSSQAFTQDRFMLRGVVRNEQGQPRAGVTVTAVPMVGGDQVQTVTSITGSFALGPLVPQQYRVTASVVGFASATQEVALGQRDEQLLVVIKPVSNSSVLLPSTPGGQLHGPSSEQPRQIPRGRGFQSLTLQAPEGLDASQSGQTAAPSPHSTGNGGASADSSDDVRTSEAFLIQGSTTMNASGDFSGGDLSDDRRQEMRDRMRERAARGDFGGGPGGWNRQGDMGGPGGPRNWGEGNAGGPGGGRGAGPFGANRIRGSIFENYHNSALDARPYSFSGLEQNKLSYIQNSWGAFVGGPLSLPKLYHGANKTSFFVGYTGSRQKTPSDTTVTVPTLAEREGDFSQSFTHIGRELIPASIYDPTLQGSNSRQFPGDRLPAERISPIAHGLLNFVPLPNLPGNVLNYHLQQNLATRSDMIISRLNHRLSAKDNLNFAYSFSQRSNDTGQAFPDFLSTRDVRGQNFNMGWSHNFTSHFINNASFRFNRLRTDTLNQFAFVDDVEGALGMLGVSRAPINYGVPTVRLTNYAGLQDSYPLLRRDQTSHVNESITYVKGNHTVRSGLEFRRIQINYRTDPNGRGTYTFNGFSTSALSPQGTPLPGTGYDLADFLLGLPQSTSVRDGEDSSYFRGNVVNLYVQDNWKVGPNLTLTLGLRYELAMPFVELRGHISNLDIAPNFTGASLVVPGGQGAFTGTFPPSLVDPDLNNLAPRMGIAWKPFGLRNTVIRSGYGIFYNASIYNQLYLQLASQPPFAVSNSLITRPDQVLTLANGFPVDPHYTILNSYAVDRHLRVGYVQQWNLDIQQQLRHNLVFILSYQGSKGNKLDLLRSPNRAPLGSSSEAGGQRLISNAQGFLYETSGASSVFHSMNLRVQRRFTSGFSLNGSYVFGKSIDNASSIGGAQETVALIDNNLRAERGLSVFDIRHQLNLSSVYELPLGSRKRYLSKGGMGARIFGDWSVSGTVTVQSGSPYTARILAGSSINSGVEVNQSQRADATGLPVTLPSDLQTVAQFFNTAAFALPAPGNFGNAGRDTITGPGSKNLNLSLDKVFWLSTEGRRLAFRTQVTNFLNTPNFTGLGTVLDASNFGRLTSAKTMRQVAFTLRFNF